MIYKANKRIVEVYKGNKEFSDVYEGDKRVFKNWEEYSGDVPASIYGTRNGVLKEYKISGNVQQNGTPTPESPVEVWGCGDRTRNLAVVENRTITKNDVTLSINNGVCSLKGFSDFSGGRLNLTTSSPFLLKSGTYFFKSYGYDNVIVTRQSDSQYLANSGQTFTLTEDTIVIIGFNVIEGTTYDISDVHIQLELGSEPTPYVPYGYEIPVVNHGENDNIDPIITPIYLPEPLYKGDYIHKDKSGGKVHREWGVKVFDGTENWSKDSNAVGENDYFYIYMPYAKFTSEILVSHFVYSKHASAIGNWWSWSTVFSLCILKSLSGIVTDDDRQARIAKFKSWLSNQYAKGTPVTVYYPLAEPTEEPIELPDLPLEIGYNTIDVETSVKPSETYMKYNGYKK